MAAEPAGRRQRRSINRGMVRRARPLLVPLIGAPAFQCCVRTQYLAKSLVYPCLVGVGAAIAAALTNGAIPVLLAAVWGLSVLYCVVAFFLLSMWIRQARRLASGKLGQEFGYRIRIRGGAATLDVQAWKVRVENAMRRRKEIRIDV